MFAAGTKRNKILFAVHELTLLRNDRTFIVDIVSHALVLALAWLIEASQLVSYDQKLRLDLSAHVYLQRSHIASRTVLNETCLDATQKLSASVSLTFSGE